jgi:hypothetical protein
MPTLHALYHPVVPSELLDLDYRVDGPEADFERAATNVSKVRATWTTIKPAVIAANGTTEASDYEPSMAVVEAEIA